MEFTKSGFNEFREDVMAALDSVAKKHDVSIQIGNIRYTSSEFDMKIRVINGFSDDAEYSESKFKHECGYFGFKPEDYNKVVIIDNQRFNFVGFNMKARKNVCLIMNPYNNKIYTCSAMTMHQAIDMCDLF